MSATARQTREAIKILFLGQCLNYGYAGVSPSSTFNSLAASSLRIRFPQINFLFGSKFLYHPIGLQAVLSHRLTLSPPDIMIISVPAAFASTPWRVNRVYEIAPEIVDTARSFLQKLRAKMGDGTIHRTTPLDKLFTTHPPLAIGEYERLIEDGVRYCQANSCRVILMGPGRFNEDTLENYQLHSPALWSSVNQMVARIGQRMNVSVIDAQEALGGHGGEVYLPNNHRWSTFGHELVAREVESILAREISEARLVLH